MPLYEYYCADCNAKFEVLTSYSASREAKVCATCQGTNVRKLFPMVARTVRVGADDGYGSYAEDYASDAGGDTGGGCCGGSCGCHNHN
jgi:putative FmdB family regulatory protein